MLSLTIYFLRYLRFFEVFNWSGKCPLWDASTQENICREFVWSGKCPSGICLVGEVSVGDVSSRGSARRGCVWSGKCPSGKSPSGICPSGMCPGIVNQFLSSSCWLQKKIETNWRNYLLVLKNQAKRNTTNVQTTLDYLSATAVMLVIF